MFGEGRYFTYVAAFGAFTDVSYETPQQSKQALGHLAYLLEGMNRLPKLPHYRARVELDGEAVEGDYIFGGVTNSTSVAGLVKLDPELVALDDGLFEVALVKYPATLADLNALVSQAVSKNYKGEMLSITKARRVRFTFPDPVPFTRDGEPWLGILKLNYKNGYTHYTETVEGAPVNSIIQQRACLPTQSGKVEEGALVDLTDYSMRLLEKKYDIDGHKEFYLSTVVFQYTTAQPEKKKLQAIQEAAVQAVQENYAETPHVEAQVAMMIANQAADNDNQVSIQQVRQQLEEEYPLAAVPFDDYVEKSDVIDSAAQPVTVTPARIRRMESRSLRTANGIEVKIPTELLNAESEVEFLHADDGSISLLIKNVIL